jgi:hypothetical protein
MTENPPDGDKPPPERDKARTKDGLLSYVGALAIHRNGEAQLRWNRASIFLVLNTSLIAAGTFIHTKAQIMDPQRWILLTCIGVAGLLLSLFWLAANMRANRWINFWNSKIAAIEEIALEPHERAIATEQFRQLHTDTFSFHHILSGLIGGFLLVWVLGFLWAYANVGPATFPPTQTPTPNQSNSATEKPNPATTSTPSNPRATKR